MSNYDLLYNELVEVSKELLPFYEIDKVKPLSVYVWYKDVNVFDIQANNIVYYDYTHKIPEKFNVVISRIQSKIKEIDACFDD